MILYPLTLASLSLITTVQALGRAIVTNQCDAPLYLWTVGSDISPQVTLARDQSYSEPLHRDPKSGGVAIKLAAVENGIFTPNVSQTVFSYSVDDGSVWFDLSDVSGDAFAGRTVSVQPSDEGCDGIGWYQGKPGRASVVRSCGVETDLEVTVCSGHCLPSWSPCGNNAPNDTRICCTHCIGSHHCVAPQ